MSKTPDIVPHQPRVDANTPSGLPGPPASQDSQPSLGQSAAKSYNPQPSTSPNNPLRKHNLTINTSRESRAASGPSTSTFPIAEYHPPREPYLPRSSSFLTYRTQTPSEEKNDVLGHSLPPSPGRRIVSVSSASNLRTFCYTPTTENLARRMAAQKLQTHIPRQSSSSSEDVQTGLSGPSNSYENAKSGDGSHEHQEAENDSPRTSGSMESVYDKKVFYLQEGQTPSQLDFVSSLPRIPATRARATEAERIAKWGPDVGPPCGGSTYQNPHNYKVLEAYLEPEDDPMHNVTDSTRRAGMLHTTNFCCEELRVNI